MESSSLSTNQSIINVVAICGSLRKGSYNRGLIRSAIELTNQPSLIPDMSVEYVDISPLPMLNTDLEKDGKYPSVVDSFRQKILESDCFLFASPEYNYSVTAPLKNAIDWASRPPNVWADKAAAIVSAGGSFGGGRSQYILRQSGVYLDLHFINKPEFFLNAFEDPPKFDEQGNLIDPAAKERLKKTSKHFILSVVPAFNNQSCVFVTKRCGECNSEGMLKLLAGHGIPLSQASNRKSEPAPIMFVRLKLYLDHLDMDLSENLSQAYTTEMDASISKIKDKGKEKVNQDDTKGVKARTSTTDMGNEKVSQDETKGVEARTSTADSDFDSE
nr:NADPH:quinone oxidoreductase-like [Tanacetum cinerariifolium]